MRVGQLSTVRRAAKTDALAVDSLLSEWFDWKPDSGRLASIHRAIKNTELLIAKITVE